MRDYMSPAVKHVTRVIQHPSVVTAIIMKHRALAFAITATLLVAVVTALMLAKNSNGAQAVHNDAIIGTTQPSLDTKVTTDGNTTQPAVDGGTMSDSTNSGSSSSQSSTNVTVNNEKIDVPQNGSVHKTIQSDNSTTTIDVTSSSSSSSDSSGSTSKSSSVNVNSVSGNVNPNTHVNTNVNRYLP